MDNENGFKLQPWQEKMIYVLTSPEYKRDAQQRIKGLIPHKNGKLSETAEVIEAQLLNKERGGSDLS